MAEKLNLPNVLIYQLLLCYHMTNKVSMPS